VPFIGVVRGSFDISSRNLHSRFCLDLAQDRPEPGNVWVAAQIRDGLPRHVTDRWKENGYGVAAQSPAVRILESLRHDLHVQRINRHSASRRRGEDEITVGAVNDNLPGEPNRYGAIKGRIPLVGMGPLLRHTPNLICRVNGLDEAHPVRVWRQFVLEGCSVAVQQMEATDETAVRGVASGLPSGVTMTANVTPVPACLSAGVCQRGGSCSVGGTMKLEYPVGPALTLKMPVSRKNRS
jgi:hypothetical protein